MKRTIVTKRDWKGLRTASSIRSRLKRGEVYWGCRRLPSSETLPAEILPWPPDWLVPDCWTLYQMILERENSLLASLTRGKIGVHDQGTTSRCWVHGSVRSLELLRLLEGQPPLMLSPDSVAYPIEGTRDRGGYPSDACAQLAKFGACPQSSWPEQDLAPNRADDNWKDQALDHVMLRWIEVDSWAKQIWLGLNRIPIAIGLGWWNHLVCQVEPVIIGEDDIGIDIDNSWGASWGDGGSAILDEESGTSDIGAFAPISETFSP